MTPSTTFVAGLVGLAALFLLLSEEARAHHHLDREGTPLTQGEHRRDVGGTDVAEATAGVPLGDLVVSTPWSRATPPAARTAAGYVTISNTGSVDDRLIAASADVSEHIELHTHIEENGVVRMRPIEGIVVPAGGEVVLEPGGLHVMFIGLTDPLAEGQSFPLTLTFERAGTVTVDVGVAALGARTPGHDHDVQ